MYIEIFAPKFPNVIIVMESYKSLVSAFLSKVCDVGDLPVQVLSFGFGN